MKKKNSAIGATETSKNVLLFLAFAGLTWLVNMWMFDPAFNDPSHQIGDSALGELRRAAGGMIIVLLVAFLLGIIWSGRVIYSLRKMKSVPYWRFVNVFILILAWSPIVATISKKAYVRWKHNSARTTIEVMPVSVEPTLANYRYEEGTCSCQATFDSTKYSREQLDNCDFLWNRIGLKASGEANSIEDMYTMNLQSIQSECDGLINKLEYMDIPDHPFWQRCRQEYLKSYSDVCELMLITAQGYTNPEILREYETADSKAVIYREALIAGGDELLAAWKLVHGYSLQINGEPETLQQRFEQEYYSKDALELARLDVMSFGWWNSLNPYTQEFIGAPFDQNFQDLLVENDCDCEMP